MIGAEFQCNVCGSASRFEPQGDWRESPSCTGCGSSVRLRSIVHVLLARILGESCVLEGVQVNKSIVGYGLSDWDGYASRLADRFTYINTFFHQDPTLDIMDLPSRLVETADFLISSDVFEHVSQPVSRAFENSFRILKPGGVLIVTVPYNDAPRTIEHYDGATDLSVVQLGSDYAVVTRDAEGKISVDPAPVFHGGPGTTLEMRMFSLDDLLAMIEAAGFIDPYVHAEPDPRWGVFPPHAYGLPISARRPPS